MDDVGAGTPHDFPELGVGGPVPEGRKREFGSPHFRDSIVVITKCNHPVAPGPQEFGLGLEGPVFASGKLIEVVGEDNSHAAITLRI